MNCVLLPALKPPVMVGAIALLLLTSSQVGGCIPLNQPAEIQPHVMAFQPGDVGLPERRVGGGTR